MSETLTKNTVIIIVGGMLFGAFGAAMVVFNLIADSKISQLEARLARDFALVREIESLKLHIKGVDTKLSAHAEHLKEGGTDGR